MEQNRFFKFIWRFNGVVIALTVTLMLCIIVWQMTRDMRRAYFPQRTTEVLNVVPAPSDAGETAARAAAEQPRFGAPQNPMRAGIYAVPQFVKQTYQNHGISKESGGNRVNFLVVNTADQSTRWLFEGRARLITDVQVLWHSPTGGARQFLGHLLHVIDTDTTNDGQLSRRDDGVLYFVPPDWTRAIPLGGSINTLLIARSVGADAFEVMHTHGRETRLRRFALPEASLVFDMPLPRED